MGEVDNRELAYKWELFISHATEDKESFVRPLADALKKREFNVWYDEFTLKLGDSLRRSIDQGLSQSRYGVVVLSHAFFKKDWPQRELDGLAALEVGGRNVILPIWHEITKDEVAQYSPTLADRKAVSSSAGLDRVIEEIMKAVATSGKSDPILKPTSSQWGRREFIGLWTKVGVIATVSNLVWRVGFDLWKEVRESDEKSEQQRRATGTLLREEASLWLQRYFFPLDRVQDLHEGAARVALVAGINDRYDPISPIKFSESGNRVSARYISAFQRGIAERIEKIQGVDDLREDDALVLIGSHEVNPIAREYFGEPEKHAPVQRVTVGGPNGSHYEVDLEWAIFTPEDARDVNILQTREYTPVLRKTREHAISCSDGAILQLSV